MHVHHRWAQSMTLIQVAIALAAITLLTRKKWLQWGVFAHGGQPASAWRLARLTQASLALHELAAERCRC